MSERSSGGAPADAGPGRPTQVSLARLAEFGIVPRRNLGQNFLIDDNIVELTLRRLEARPDDVAIEVGAGLGVLTKALLGATACVHAFEIDRRLEPPLRATLGHDPRLRLRMEDIMRVRLEDLDPAPTVCASNLPYSVAAPFLAEAVARLPQVRRYCVMMQKEVADRLTASPGVKDYGSLSVWMQLHVAFLDARPLSRAIFHPRPNVDSTLLTMERSIAHPLVESDPKHLRRVIDAAFASRRKTLANSLSGALGLDKQRVLVVLESEGLTDRTRGEELPPEAYLQLAEAVARL
jgi:16S rRNA (adenine1518-N6/adenine1519-N6)-dimethyltransferase